jgi:hypothetical protein
MGLLQRRNDRCQGPGSFRVRIVIVKAWHAGFDSGRPRRWNVNPKTLIRMLGLQGAVAAVAAASLWAQAKPEVPATALSFDTTSSAALRAMKARADELHVSGVAVVAYAEGASVASWSSKMLVVGTLTQPPSAKDKGNNLLGIAYCKAAEMASTLKDSGSGVRPPLTGEFGWQGGVVAKGRTGILIAAFSGGRSEDDVKVSRAGLAVLAQSL